MTWPPPTLYARPALVVFQVPHLRGDRAVVHRLRRRVPPSHQSTYSILAIDSGSIFDLSPPPPCSVSLCLSLSLSLSVSVSLCLCLDSLSLCLCLSLSFWLSLSPSSPPSLPPSHVTPCNAVRHWPSWGEVCFHCRTDWSFRCRFYAFIKLVPSIGRSAGGRSTATSTSLLTIFGRCCGGRCCIVVWWEVGGGAM